MPLDIVRNDITLMNVDAIVNAANSTLLGGGGVDGAIHRAAGPELLEACRKLGGCETGASKITPGYRLPAKYVIHTVGPVYEDGRHGEKALLESCYESALALARQYHCESVAFPLISSGVYGYPKGEALRVAIDTISRFLLDNDMRVYIVVFDKSAFEISGRLFQDVAAYIDDVYADEHSDSVLERRRRLNRTDMAPAAQPSPPKAPARPQKRGLRLPFPRSRADEAPEETDAVFAPRPSFDFRAGLDDALSHVDESFSQMLLREIDERGMTDVECYKRANIDRRLFSKIRSNPEYRPAKTTAVALAMALRMDMRETREFLMKAGYALSHSSRFDIIVEYFILHENWNVMEINEVLFKFDQALLGAF